MITFDHLTKTYSAATVLDDVSFTAPAGAITGFLGPNGAGKTTAMRVLLGMAHATSGRALVGGRPYTAWPHPGSMVGTLLSADCFHPGRTGRESLLLACLMLGIERCRADAVLERVGLTPREARRRVAGYSLGMRQRLGLAQALLAEPPALVLDEPTNGLDPQGQRWLGDLLREQAERGCAVLLSSHQLADVERIADRLVVIGGGRVRADDTVAALRRRHGDITEFYFAATARHDRAA